MRPADRADLWWRAAVIYCLDIEKFQDSDGDGVGDIDGLIERIEYLAGLGVSCLWLMPFQSTANRDDGYDITDYYGVDSRLGDLGRFVELIRVAHDRGMRIIIDLVINHTSDQHPWFVSARSDRDSPYRDFYVWRDAPPEDQGENVFPDTEEGIWTKDDATGQYYLHHFYSHQPELNFANPTVRAEIARIIGFWLQLGVDGFRIDSVPFVIEPPGVPDEADPHAFMRELHRFAGRRRGSGMLLGEVGLDHTDQLPYFGESGTELDLQLDFLIAQTMFLSFVRHDPQPLAEVLSQRPVVDLSQGWAMFLRSHDELSLELLGDTKQEVFETLAPDPRQRVYDRGIVRRTATMLEGDPRRVRLAHSLLFSLPGAPLIYYGEEIGMGEPGDTSGRDGMRTPMQWSSGRNGGFSSASESALVAPLTAGDFGPEHVNVYDQERDPGSLLNFVRTLIAQYRATPEIAWGDFAVIDVDEPGVLVHSCRSGTAAFIAVHNFEDEPCTVELPLTRIVEEDADIIDLLESADLDVAETLTIELGSYGHRWLRATARSPK
ncbi:trehalose synthase [Brevibacterium sanguinis]|uniref:Trehalose synthase n=2 Tax=Brevibacterium TaxID=1696 RepID=A0A366IMD9_9MICO|nr:MULTISPECIES: alpha-amylase family protein [Brevibacterium]RBP66209.1 trehalose synthase [Brevibacterium sanguinis]RBP72860.1 trehalose synthase [Brevibacterium celere]